MLVAVYTTAFHDPSRPAVTHLDEHFAALAGYFLRSGITVFVNLIVHLPKSSPLGGFGGNGSKLIFLIDFYSISIGKAVLYFTCLSAIDERRLATFGVAASLSVIKLCNDLRSLPTTLRR